MKVTCSLSPFTLASCFYLFDHLSTSLDDDGLVFFDRWGDLVIITEQTKDRVLVPVPANAHLVVILRLWVTWMVRICLYILHSSDSTVTYLFESVIGGSLKKQISPKHNRLNNFVLLCFSPFSLFGQTTRSIITLIKKSHTGKLYKYSCEICD